MKLNLEERLKSSIWTLKIQIRMNIIKDSEITFTDVRILPFKLLKEPVAEGLLHAPWV